MRCMLRRLAHHRRWWWVVTLPRITLTTQQIASHGSWCCHCVKPLLLTARPSWFTSEAKIPQLPAIYVMLLSRTLRGTPHHVQHRDDAVSGLRRVNHIIDRILPAEVYARVALAQLSSEFVPNGLRRVLVPGCSDLVSAHEGGGAF